MACRFGELGKVDVDGVEPALRALQAGDGTLRADKPVDFADKCAPPHQQLIYRFRASAREKRGEGGEGLKY